MYTLETMQSTSLQKRKNIGKEETKPGIQPWLHTKVTNQRGGAEIGCRRENNKEKI